MPQRHQLRPRPIRQHLLVPEQQAPRKEASGYPVGFTHHELAREVYSTDEPTAAQESAVRRAVAALVAAGKAERDTADRPLNDYEHRRSSRHLRQRRYDVYEYANPMGILIRRVMTPDDREARAAVAEAMGAHEYSERVRRGEAQ